jgi:amino acid adenylation domain-containing protein
MNASDIEDIYGLSPVQKGMLFHSLAADEPGMYVVQFSCSFDRGLDVAAFEAAWREVIARTPILRTAFYWKEADRLLQVVQRRVDVPIAHEDWRALDRAEQTVRLEAFLRQDRERGFELSTAPLLRLALLRTSDEAYRFTLSLHHLLLDGWSLSLVLKDVFTFYEALARGKHAHVPQAPPYGDYIAWLERQDLGAAERYWRRRLAGFTTPTPIGITLRTDGAQGEQGLRLSPEVTAAARELARRHAMTLSTLVQGTWALVLGRASGQREVVFGSTVSGRPPSLPGVEAMIGLFINTLPVRIALPGEQPISAWLKTLQDEQLELQPFEHTPLTELQSWSEIPRGQSLFDSILVFENYPIDSSLKDGKSALEIRDLRSEERTNYPLTVVAEPGAQLGLRMLYDGRRFDDETIANLLLLWKATVEAMVAHPEQTLGELPRLTDDERRLLEEWNHTRAEYPRDRRIDELVTAQAAQHPDALAIAGDGERVTYAQLERRANQLAHRLRNLGVKLESRVALYLPRSVDLVIAALAVIKAGGTYLPLDPGSPRDRVRFMLEDANAQVVLTHARLAGELPVRVRVVELDTERALLALEAAHAPPNPAGPEHLAYLIYTSGSTGRPKGVEVRHAGLANLVAWHQHAYELTAADRATLVASPAFDASVWETWPYLASGASLHVPPEAVRSSPPELLAWLAVEQITLTFLPTPLAEAILDEPWPAHARLRAILTGGDQLHRGPRPEVRARLVNHYGPTESTVVTSFARVAPGLAGPPPIGRPIANTEVHLLDADLQPVGIGAPGELCIGGDGLARGYHARPELTADKFAPDAMSGRAGARLYRTGDLARWLPDGNLEFLGRIDQQVKIRGFRIELGEIEAVLGQHPRVRACAVIAREDGGPKRLVAYVTGDATLDELRAVAASKLPDYMVPLAFVALDALPLTPNGKIDRKALPAPVEKATESAPGAARTPLEEVLASIWSEVLGVARVGADDDFFALGGHSLSAIQIVSRLRRLLDVDLPLCTLFQAGTVKSLADRVARARRSESAPLITPAPPAAHDPLSFAQEFYWTWEKEDPGNPQHTVPVAFRLDGALDLTALRRSLDELVRRHDALRSSFRLIDGQPAQVIAPALSVHISRVDLTQLPEGQRLPEAQRLAGEAASKPFALDRPPLLRVTLFQLAPDRHALLLLMHHSIVDLWSFGVLLRELTALYDAFRAGKPSPLEPLAIQYRDFARWQRDWLSGDRLASRLAWWKQQLAGPLPSLELPTDRPASAAKTKKSATQSFALSPALSNALKSLSRKEGVTPFMTLLAGYQTLLCKLTGADDLTIGFPSANRTQREIEPLIGMFANTLVLRTKLDGDPTFAELLARVREVCLGAFDHQDLPYSQLVRALRPSQKLSEMPLIQVGFSYLGDAGGTAELGGLSVEPLQLDAGAAQFELALYVFDRPDGLSGAFEYQAERFDAATVQRIERELVALLERAVANPDQPLSSLLGRT